MNAEKFRESVKGFDRDFGRVRSGEQRLLERVRKLEQGLQDLMNREPATGVSQRHDAAKLVHELKSAINGAIRQWTEMLAAAAPVRGLSEKYEDRAILLVFGKVNSGKSTFVNLLVDELQRAGAGARGFALKSGEEIDAAPQFAVGATETTARIQGVEVDDRLVLLDSPGLHSVTEENHDLTKLFTDSADAVLWLTPSTSPGQVQELRDLTEELNRKKPLLPVITKSDYPDEDWCEATERITREWRNKTAENRKAQEDDVLSRTRQLGLKGEIRPVISISVLVYEKGGRSDDAREKTGLGRLYDCLVDLVDHANQYKTGKAEQVARNYIDEQVIRAIDQCVKPAVSNLVTGSDRWIQDLDGAKRQQIKDDVQSDALSQIRRIADRHRATQNKKAIADELVAAVNARLAEALLRELSEYVGELSRSVAPLLKLSAADLSDFEDITIDYERKKGAAARSVSTSVVGAAGTALGTLIPIPVVGNVIGGIIGSIAGNLIGRLFASSESVSEVVGVTTESLMTSAQGVMDQKIADYVDTVVDAAIATIKATKMFAEDVNSEIDHFNKEVRRIPRP